MKRMQVIGLMGVFAVGIFIGAVAHATACKPTKEETIVVEEKAEMPKVKAEIKNYTPTVIEVVRKEEPKKTTPVWTDVPLTAEEQIALYEKCEELEINYWFLIALCESESSFIPDAVGDSGKSIGYMQINKCNWERMKTDYGLDVHEPIDNLLCGAYIFKELATKYDTITQVVMSYKCGESRAKELLEQGIVLSAVEELTNRTIELENAHH